jgi:predicted MFS family arabinose efflux permease
MPKLSREFGSVIGFYFLSTSFSFIQMLLIPIFVQHYGYTTDFALKVQTFSFLAVILYLVWFSRFINRNYITQLVTLILIGMTCGVLSLIFSPPHFSIFILCIALYMIGKSTQTTLTSFFLEGTSSKESRLSASAFLHMTANAGAACSGVISYLFFSKNKNLLLGIDLATTIMFVTSLFYAIKKIPKINKLENKATDSIFKAAQSLNSKKILFIIASVFFGIAGFNNYSGIPALFIKLGLDPTKATSLMSITNTLAVVFGTFLIGKFSIKNKQFYLIISSLILALGMVLVPFSTNTTMVVISTVIWTIAEAVGWPIIIFYYYEIFTNKSVAAQFRNVYVFSCLFLSPLFAWSIENLPVYYFSFAYGGVSILSALIFMVISKELKQMQELN